MAGTFTSLHYHLVFSTKDRFPFLTPALQPRLYEYIGGILRADKGTLLEIGGMPDHLHILAHIHQSKTVSDVLRALKSKSSGWIHSNYPEKSTFAWQGGYGAFTVSKSALPQVTAYIQNQEEHHRTRTFQEEFLLLLQAHGLDYNEQFLWD